MRPTTGGMPSNANPPKSPMAEADSGQEAKSPEQTVGPEAAQGVAPKTLKKPPGRGGFFRDDQG